MLSRYLKEKFWQERFLTSANIEVTTACNMKCKHCYVCNRSIYHTETFLDFERIKEIVLQLKDMGTIRIGLTGGEPLIHPRIFDIIDFIKSKNISVSLLSNITLINSKSIEYLKNKVDVIHTTKYGFNESSYESLTQIRGSYSKYINAIKLLKKNNILCMERGILLANNEQNLEQMIRETSMVETRIDISKDDTYAQRVLPSYRSLEKYYEYMVQNYNVGEFFFKSGEDNVCSAGNNFLFIASDGSIYPCPIFQISLGNIKRDKIKDVWNSEKIEKVKELTKYKNFKKCISCDNRKYNTHWCIATNYYETGAYYRPSKFACEHCLRYKNALERAKNNEEFEVK